MKPLRFFRRLGLSAIAVLCLAGCNPTREYRLSMQPDGDVVERQFTYRSARLLHNAGQPDGEEFIDLSAAELKRLEQFYPPSQLTPAPVRRKFDARFRGRLPDDVGNFGRYQRLVSSLGDSFVYVERVRGKQDLAAGLAQATHAADRLADLLVAWLQSELGADGDAAKVKTFCDTTLRRDLKNLFLLIWVQNVTHFEASENLLARVMLVLCERNYLQLADLPAWQAAVEDLQTRDDGRRLMARLQRMLADQLGYAGQPVPAVLAPLNDFTKVRTSLEKFLRSTDEYAAVVAEAKQDVGAGIGPPPDPAAADTPPSPYLALFPLVVPLMDDPFRFGGTDHLTVDLTVPTAPGQIDTNGKYDPQTGKIAWQADITESPSRLPTVLYAMWELPDEAAQTACFGCVPLRRETLREYCLWVNGLEPADRAEWLAFLAKLNPGPGLRPALAAFRFTSDVPQDPAADAGTRPSRIEPIRQKILANLPAE